MIEIEAPNGDVIEFPEGTSDEAIKKAMSKAYPPGSGGGYSGNILSALTEGSQSGMLMGWDDEIGAGMIAPVNAALDWAQGEGFDVGKAYDEAKATLEARKKSRREEMPVASTTGEIIGGLTLGGGAATKGLTLMGKTASLPKAMLAASAEGAVYGGITGAGEAEEGERLDGGAEGATTGAVLGAAVPLVGEAVKRVVKPVTRKLMPKQAKSPPVDEAASRELLYNIEQSGISPEDAIEGVKQGRVLAQQDPLMMDMTRVIKDRGGKTGKLIGDRVQEGFEVSQEAATKAVKDGLGGAENFYTWLDDFKAAKKSKAKPLYEKAFSENWGTKGPPMNLSDIIERAPDSALKDAGVIAKAEGREGFKQIIASIDDNGAVTLAREPSLEEAEIIRRALDGQASKAYRAGDGAVGEAISDLAYELRQVIDEASPRLRGIRKMYADDYAIERAAEAGKTWISKGGAFIENEVGKLKGPERIAAARGFAAGLEEQIERGQISHDVVKKMFGSKRVRRALGSLWKDEKSFNAFTDQMENAAEFNMMRGRVTGNSKTAQYLTQAERMKQRMQGALDTATGPKLGIVAKGIDAIAAKFDDVNEDALYRVAETLLERDPIKFEALLYQSSKGKTAAQNKLVDEIIQKISGSPTVAAAGVASSQ